MTGLLRYDLRRQFDPYRYEYVFGPVLGKVKTYPTKLRGELEKREKSLAKQARLTRRSFYFFMGLALLPALGAAWKAWVRYPEIEGRLRVVCSFVGVVIGSIVHLVVRCKALQHIEDRHKASQHLSVPTPSDQRQVCNTALGRAMA